MALVLRILIMEVIVYFKVRSYRNVPGVATYYFPLMGWLNMVNKPAIDQHTEISEFFREHSDKHMIISNRMGDITVLTISGQSIKDLVLKERDYLDRVPIPGFDIDGNKLGFSVTGGSHAMMMRSVFVDFFTFDKIQALYEPMYRIMETHFAQFLKNKGISKTETKEVNLQNLFAPIMTDWLVLFLFGFESSKDLMMDFTDYPEILNGEFVDKMPLDANNRVDVLT